MTGGPTSGPTTNGPAPAPATNGPAPAPTGNGTVPGSTGGTGTPLPPDGDPAVMASQLWTLLGTVVAPTTLVTALMYYFGWARAKASFGEFGVDLSTLGLSPQDYVLRSIDTTIKAVSLVLGIVLMAPLAHRALLRAVRRSLPHRRGWPTSVARLIVGLGVLTVAGAAAGLGPVQYKVRWPAVPLGLGVGTLLVGYGLYLGRALTTRPAPYLASAVPRAAFAGFLVVMIFWSTADWAHTRGQDIAWAIQRNPLAQPGVVVFATDQLGLEEGQAGVTEKVAGPKASSGRYRYDGFRLLVRAGGRYFLLPACWQKDNGSRVVALPEDAKVRLEFLPKYAPGARPC